MTATKVGEAVLAGPNASGTRYDHVHTLPLGDVVLTLGQEYSYSDRGGVTTTEDSDSVSFGPVTTAFGTQHPLTVPAYVPPTGGSAHLFKMFWEITYDPAWSGDFPGNCSLYDSGLYMESSCTIVEDVPGRRKLEVTSGYFLNDTTSSIDVVTVDNGAGGTPITHRLWRQYTVLASAPGNEYIPAYSSMLLARVITLSGDTPANGATGYAPFQGQYSRYTMVDAQVIDGTRAVVIVDPHFDGTTYFAAVVQYAGGEVTWGDWCLVSGHPDTTDGQSGAVIPASQREEDLEGWIYDVQNTSYPDLCVLSDGSAVAGFVVRAIDTITDPSYNTGVFHLAVRHLDIDGVTVTCNGKIQFLDAGTQMYGPAGYNSRFIYGMARKGSGMIVASYYSLRDASDSSLDQDNLSVLSVQVSGAVFTPGAVTVVGSSTGGVGYGEYGWWNVDSVAALPTGGAAVLGYGPSGGGQGVLTFTGDSVVFTSVDLASTDNPGSYYGGTGNLEYSVNSQSELTSSGGFLLSDYGNPTSGFLEVKVTGTPARLQTWTWDTSSLPSPAVAPPNEYEVVAVGSKAVVLWIDDDYSTRGATVFALGGGPQYPIAGNYRNRRARFSSRAI